MNRLENWFCGTALWRRITQRELLPWILEGVNLGEQVLEVGAGPGAATAVLAQSARSLTSLEYSHEFCVALHSKGSAANIVQGDAATLPFAACSFTGAIAVLVLHHLHSVEAQDRALAEFFRVLKPGSVFVVAEINEDWLTRVVHFRSTFVPVVAAGLVRRLRRVGFSDIDVGHRSGRFRLHAVRRN